MSQESNVECGKSHILLNVGKVIFLLSERNGIEVNGRTKGAFISKWVVVKELTLWQMGLMYHCGLMQVNPSPGSLQQVEDSFQSCSRVIEGVGLVPNLPHSGSNQTNIIKRKLLGKNQSQLVGKQRGRNALVSIEWHSQYTAVIHDNDVFTSHSKHNPQSY
jgi:hypothetical protein